MLYIYFVLPWIIIDCRENVILKVSTFLGMIYMIFFFLHDFFNLLFFPLQGYFSIT